MKNKIIIFIKTIFALTVLESCDQINKKAINEKLEQKTTKYLGEIKLKVVDYKSDIYKITLGSNYKNSNLIFNWQWAAEADSDGKIDSTGEDSFMFLGEPLINYNNGEWLPFLYIETDKNIIKLFTVSVLFSLANTMNAKVEFLKILSKDIKQLQNNEVINKLIAEGIYEIKTQEVNEVFRLIKREKGEYEYFEYTAMILPTYKLPLR